MSGGFVDAVEIIYELRKKVNDTQTKDTGEALEPTSRAVTIWTSTKDAPKITQSTDNPATSSDAPLDADLRHLLDLIGKAQPDQALDGHIAELLASTRASSEDRMIRLAVLALPFEISGDSNIKALQKLQNRLFWSLLGVGVENKPTAACLLGLLKLHTILDQAVCEYRRDHLHTASLPPPLHPKLPELLQRLPAHGPWRVQMNWLRKYWVERRASYESTVAATSNDIFDFTANPLFGTPSTDARTDPLVAEDVRFVLNDWLTSDVLFDDERHDVFDTVG